MCLTACMMCAWQLCPYMAEHAWSSGHLSISANLFMASYIREPSAHHTSFQNALHISEMLCLSGTSTCGNFCMRAFEPVVRFPISAVPCCTKRQC